MPNPQPDGLGPLGALRSTRKHPLQQGLVGDDIPPIDFYNLGHQRAHRVLLKCVSIVCHINQNDLQRNMTSVLWCSTSADTFRVLKDLKILSSS